MTRARDIMTGSLITCSPEMSVTEAARLMRDRNTGDVLVTDDGKLHGIITDRDIAVRVTAKGLDPQDVPIRDVMSKRVVTGEPKWDVEKISKTMGKHQVRRLPIVDNGMLVGIVSLGDLALRDRRERDVVKSLKHISEPGRLHLRHSAGSRLMPLLGLGLVAGAVIALTMSPKPLSEVWDDIRDSRLAELIDNLRDSDVAEQLVDLVDQGRSRLADLRG